MFWRARVVAPACLLTLTLEIAVAGGARAPVWEQVVCKQWQQCSRSLEVGGVYAWYKCMACTFTYTLTCTHSRPVPRRHAAMLARLTRCKCTRAHTHTLTLVLVRLQARTSTHAQICRHACSFACVLPSTHPHCTFVSHSCTHARMHAGQMQSHRETGWSWGII